MSKTCRKHPDAVAWEQWLNSEEGQTCSDPATTDRRPAFRHYMENRLWRAFMAGVKAKEQQAPAPRATGRGE